MMRRKLLSALAAACLWAVPPAFAQEPAFAQDPAPAPPPRAEVADVQIEGDLGIYDEDELRALIRARPARRFLGIPGATPSRWVYSLGQSTGGALGRALERAGEAPRYLQPAAIAQDSARLAGTYQAAGFRTPRVDTRIDTIGVGRVRVTFRVDPGPPTFLRLVRYAGLQALPPPRRLVLAQPQVLGAAPVPGEPMTFSGTDGQRFAEADLLAERQRMVETLQEWGYALVGRDSVRAVVFPVPGAADSVDVTLEVRPGPRVRFGDVRVGVRGPDGSPPRLDTLHLNGAADVPLRIVGDGRLRPSLLDRSLRIEPGAWYSAQAVQQSRRRLERTGVFTFVDVDAAELDAFRTDSTSGELGAPRIPFQIGLRARPRHSVRVEGFVLQRTGLFGPDPDETGLGAALAYRNANLFGAGEQLQAQVAGSVAGDVATGFPTAQGETSLSLALPYLVGWRRSTARELFDTRTRLSLSFLAARREDLRLLVRGRASAQMRYELRHTETLASLVDAVDFDLSDPDTLGGFGTAFLDVVQDPVARELLLEDYTRPQVNSAVRYTLRSLTADPFRRDRGHAREAQVEVGGNLPWLLDRLVFSPDTLEGSLPGVPLFGATSGARLEYRPYARALADVRQYVPLGTETLLALKGIAGFAHPTGETPVVPFDRRFYAGGATSVRGWRQRRLGPGRSAQPGAFVQGGEVKLEMSAELRRVLLREFFAADYQLAFFADAGNVWFGPRNPGDPDGRFRAGGFYEEIGVSAGLGLRIVWDFVALRFDFAYRVHDPQPGVALFPDPWRAPLFHFGIGQAF